MIEVKTGPPILTRIVWYFLVGWWLTGIGMAIAWLAALTLIGLPLSFLAGQPHAHDADATTPTTGIPGLHGTRRRHPYGADDDPPETNALLRIVTSCSSVGGCRRRGWRSPTC